MLRLCFADHRWPLRDPDLIRTDLVSAPSLQLPDNPCSQIQFHIPDPLPLWTWTPAPTATFIEMRRLRFSNHITFSNLICAALWYSPIYLMVIAPHNLTLIEMMELFQIFWWGNWTVITNWQNSFFTVTKKLSLQSSSSYSVEFSLINGANY